MSACEHGLSNYEDGICTLCNVANAYKTAWKDIQKDYDAQSQALEAARAEIKKWRQVFLTDDPVEAEKRLASAIDANSSVSGEIADLRKEIERLTQARNKACSILRDLGFERAANDLAAPVPPN